MRHSIPPVLFFFYIFLYFYVLFVKRAGERERGANGGAMVGGKEGVTVVIPWRDVTT